jgi:hypothetical protein
MVTNVLEVENDGHVTRARIGHLDITIKIRGPALGDT